MPGAQRARSLAGQKKQAMPVTVTTVTPENPAFPAQWFYGFLRALPGDRALLPPSLMQDNSRENLTPASGCQDHTTSPSARRTFVSVLRSVHRIPFRVRDDREPPPWKERDATSIF